MWSNNHLNIGNGFLDPENPILYKNTMILYGIPSKIEQLPYSAAILDAILNCKNAMSGSFVHPPDSWTSWSKAIKNAKKRLLPNISRFNTPAAGLLGVLTITRYTNPRTLSLTRVANNASCNWVSLLQVSSVVQQWTLLNETVHTGVRKLQNWSSVPFISCAVWTFLNAPKCFLQKEVLHKKIQNWLKVIFTRATQC